MNFYSSRLFITAFFAGLVLTKSTTASVVSVTGDLNDSFFNSPPANLAVGGPLQNSNEFYALCESEFTTLAADLTKVGEATVGSTYNSANKPPYQTIPAGTVVNSTMIHFDPSPTAQVVGTITFPTPILGIIWKTGDLNSTDAIFGIPGTTYPGAARGTIEGRDIVKVVDAYTLDLLFYAATDYTDTMRVITEPFHCTPVPEPGSTALFSLILGLSASLRRRRRP